MNRDDAGLWHEASEQEYKALLEHGVWELCELPGRKPVGSRWVYCIKTNSDGSVERYKARLVAQGFSQKPHLDYTETFAQSPKLHLCELCLLLLLRIWMFTWMSHLPS